MLEFVVLVTPSLVIKGNWNGLIIQVSAGAGVSSKGMTVERPTSVITYITAGTRKFLKACWTEIFNSLTVGWSWLESILSSLPCGPLQCFIRFRRQSARPFQAGSVMCWLGY